MSRLSTTFLNKDITHMSDIPDKFKRIVKNYINSYKNNIINNYSYYDNTSNPEYNKYLEEYCLYIYELLHFVCRIKNVGYITKHEVQPFIDNYIMPKINNDLFSNSNNEEEKELKFFLKTFFIQSSDNFKAGEHLSETQFNIKFGNLVEYNNEKYNINCNF